MCELVSDGFKSEWLALQVLAEMGDTQLACPLKPQLVSQMINDMLISETDFRGTGRQIVIAIDQTRLLFLA